MGIDKEDKKRLLAIGLVLAVVWLLRPIGNEEMMTFYDHKECLVYGDWVIGCEGSGTTYIHYITDNENWEGFGSCTAWLNNYGCKPENCNYVDNGVCDGVDNTNTLSRECSTDEECMQRFKNTGWKCNINPLKMERECVFEGNHMESGTVEVFGIESKEEELTFMDKIEEFRKPLVIAAGAGALYLVGII